MLQLVAQTSILLRTYETSGITTLQILGISSSLVMASKGSAEEYLAAKLKRAHGRDGETKLFHKMDLKAKLLLLGELI